jgi:hypothetical protein
LLKIYALQIIRTLKNFHNVVASKRMDFEFFDIQLWVFFVDICAANKMVSINIIHLFWGNHVSNRIQRCRVNTILWIIVFFSQSVSAQTMDLGSWNIVHVKYHPNSKLSYFAEAQLRSLKFYNHFHYYEYKGGFDYKLHKDVKIALGGGSYQTYREGGNFVLPKNNNEFRLWPQLILNQTIAGIKVEQRYRSEFRFTQNGYRNRFRYRVGISYPFGPIRNKEKPFQLSVSNELFFTNSEPYFERNRLLIAMNYKITPVSHFQLGYLHQFDYKINDETGRDFLVAGFYLDIFPKSNNSKEVELEIHDN